MDETRKIVLVLGNGFDLDLGLKTSYKDFWESEFCPKDYPSPLINHLNERWGDHLDNVRWYDLESEILAYYKQLDFSKPLKDVVSQKERAFLDSIKQDCFSNVDAQFYEAANSLYQKGYIIEKPNKLSKFFIPYHSDFRFNSIWRDRKSFQIIKEQLCKYLTFISGGKNNNDSLARIILLAVIRAYDYNNIVDIYNFNYTTLPEVNRKKHNTIIHYVHGSCESNSIIIGTLDDKDINKDYVFIQKAFDPKYNPPTIVANLLNADEVIIFGHSIGENDRQYFKSFFKQQTAYSGAKEKEITIITKSQESEIEIKRALQYMTDSNLSSLYGHNHLRILKTDNISEDQQEIISLVNRLIPNSLVQSGFRDLINKYIGQRSLDHSSVNR